MRLDWTAIRLLYLNEVRSAFRDRSIVINAVLVPLLMYPLMMWVGFSAIVFIGVRSQGFDSRVEIVGLPAEHAELEERLSSDDAVELVSRLDEGRADADLQQEFVDRIRAGELDAALLFDSRAASSGAGAAGAAELPATGDARADASSDEPAAGATDRRDAGDELAVALLSDSSNDRSRTARGRLEDAVRDYRADWLDDIAASRGLGGADWQVFDVRSENLATNREMGQFLLGLMIPLFFVIMIAGGCLYPAVDSTAGERERDTWETTCTLATERLSVVAAKYLYVATMGSIAGILNVGAMTVSFGTLLVGFLSRLSDAGAADFAMRLPYASLPLMVLFAVLAASLIGAALMILAAFARTIKEGQGLVMPLYLALILPIAFLNDPGLEITPGLASIPLVNVVLLLRTAIGGDLPPLEIGIAFVSNTAAIALCLWLASFVLRMEEVVTGSFGGSPYQYLSRKLRPGRGRT